MLRVQLRYFHEPCQCKVMPYELLCWSKGLKSRSAGDSKGNDGQSLTSTSKINKVQEIYQNFNKNYDLQPYIERLYHYSMLTTRVIPLPMNQFSHLGLEISTIYKGLFSAQLELSVSPMVQASATGKKIAGLCENIKSLNLTDAQAIEAMSQNFKACIAEVDGWRLRSDLIEDVKKLNNNNLNWG